MSRRIRANTTTGRALHGARPLSLWALVGPLALAAAACATAPEPAPQGPVFYPPAPETPRIQFLTSYNSDQDLVGKPGRFQRFVVGETQPRQLGKPYGLALYEGKLFVCDTRVKAVVIFDLVGRRIDMMGNRQPGQLEKPVNLAIDEAGTRYVADTGRRRIMVYDAQNRYVTAFGKPDEWSPTDVVLAGDEMYVTDRDQGNVVVLDRSSGEELRRFGRLFLPTNLEVDPDDNVYVTDTGNARVLKFDPEGEVLQQFGSLGRRLGQFVRPKGVAVDRDGRLYVADAAFHNVQVFAPSGELLMFFGGDGRTRGGVNLPAKVEITYDGVELFEDLVAPGYGIEYLILVTSQFGSHKVNVYGFLREEER